MRHDCCCYVYSANARDKPRIQTQRFLTFILFLAIVGLHDDSLDIVVLPENKDMNKQIANRTETIASKQNRKMKLVKDLARKNTKQATVCCYIVL